MKVNRRTCKATMPNKAEFRNQCRPRQAGISSRRTNRFDRRKIVGFVAIAVLLGSAFTLVSTFNGQQGTKNHDNSIRSATLHGKAHLNGLPKNTPVLLTFPCTASDPQSIKISGAGIGTVIRKIALQPVSSRLAYVRRDPGSAAVLGSFSYGPMASWRALDANSIIEVSRDKKRIIDFIFQSSSDGLHIGGSGVISSPTFEFAADDLTKVCKDRISSRTE